MLISCWLPLGIVYSRLSRSDDMVISALATGLFYSAGLAIFVATTTRLPALWKAFSEAFWTEAKSWLMATDPSGAAC